MMPHPKKILLVEDNSPDALLLQEMLARVTHMPMDLCWAECLHDTLDKLQRETFDAILLDLSLPDSSGLDTIRQVSQSAPATPILVMTGVTDEQIAMEAVRCGAEDYLIKGQNDVRSVARAIGYAIDRKRREEHVAKLTRLYAVLSEVNEAIVRTRNAGSLYAEVCRIVAEKGGFPLAWIGKIEGPRVVPVASFGPAARYLEEIRIEVQGVLSRGPTGTSIREGRAAVNDDFSVSPATAPWREAALRYGFLASAAFPLHHQGNVIGALTLYACEAGAFDAQQVELLESLSADISYALDAIEHEQVRVQAEKALLESRERLALAIDAGQIGMFVWHVTTGELFLTMQTEVMFGHTPSAPTTISRYQQWAQQVHPDDLPQVEQLLQRCLKEKASFETRYRVVWPDGTVHWIEMRGRPEYDVDGQSVRMLGTTVDITDRKRDEEALRKAHDELELRVQERTAELAETVDQLHKEMDERIRAEHSLQHEHRTLVRLLQAQDRERQAISLGIHDSLAQPMVSATMHLEAASGMSRRTSKAAAEAQAAGIAMLRESINEARRMISGVRPPILEDEGVEAAISHLAYESRGSDAPRVEFHIDASFERLHPDLESAIYRIAQEGLDNACKHSGSDRVWIELVQQEERLRIEIRDWGMGFDPQAVKEESFGLEELRERARLLGGSSSIESSPGNGTRIVAELPLRLPDEH